MYVLLWRFGVVPGIPLIAHTWRAAGCVEKPRQNTFSGSREASVTILIIIYHSAGQMDLLTVPSADGVDSKVIQVEKALSASSRDR